MTSQVLEQIVGNVFAGNISLTNFYTTIDSYTEKPIGLYSGKPLTIRDFPSSGVQLHIHEGQGGTAHLKTYKNEKIKINSYDAAMLDLRMDKAGLLKYRV